MRWARDLRLALAAAGVGVTVLGCGDEGGGSDLAGTLATEQTHGIEGAGDDGPGANDIGEGSAPVVAVGSDVRITCDADSMMTDLGWPQLPASPVVGAVYMATLSYVGDEPCIAARFDSVLLDAVPQTTPVPGPLPVAVTRGLDIDIGPAVPAELREQMRADLIEPAELLLENANVTWIERPAGEWLAPGNTDSAVDAQAYRLRAQQDFAVDAFALIVTRAYSAERVTNLDGGTDGLPMPAYYAPSNDRINAAYECAALPLGDGGAFQLFDGVFVDLVDPLNSGSLTVRADLPRRFCPELPGVDVPPGNGALPPAP